MRFKLLDLIDLLTCSPYYQVPALEHNGKVIGESLDLIKYVDINFEGPSLLPNVRFAWFICALVQERLSGFVSVSVSPGICLK